MIPNRSPELSDAFTPDEGLVLQVAQGDEAAFERLYDRFAPKVFGMVSRLLNDENQREDVTQKAFVDAWVNAAGFDPRRTTALTWLLGIAHGYAVERLRSTSTQPDPGSIGSIRTLQKGDQLSDEDAVFQNEGERITAALQQLTEVQQEAIHLAYFGGLKHREIADRLQLPVGMVQAAIQDGMKKLRDLMGVA